ncbi:hypothetical protein [Kineococcus sp. NBC_00420]|uniref:hypothetical protein n=1 Tax=Kineococcus sp. NBC_00420 TaxID=2903564 RepID=UPI003FA5E53F
MDHQPVNPGHVLVAPRHHLPLFEDPDDVAGNAFRRTHHRHPAARARLADAEVGSDLGDRLLPWLDQLHSVSTELRQ